MAGCANAGHISLASGRCALPGWSYEVFVLPGPPGPTRDVTGWDCKQWFAPSYAPVYPPPHFVHVLVLAGAGAHGLGLVGLNFAGNPTVRNPTGALLNPRRTRAVSLGRVRWYGHRGELILEPTGGQSGGELAGHLVFLFTSSGVECAITVDAWVQKVREMSRGRSHLIQAPQTGPALPDVIATLRAIIDARRRRKAGPIKSVMCRSKRKLGLTGLRHQNRLPGISDTTGVLGMPTLIARLDMPLEEATAATRQVAGAQGWSLAEGESTTHHLVLKKGISPFSWGKQLRVSLDSVSASQTRIVVAASETFVLTDWGRGRRAVHKLFADLGAHED